MRISRMTAAAVLMCAGMHAVAGHYRQTATGIDVEPGQGAARLVRLNLMSENIIEVLKLDAPGKALTPSLMTVAKPCSCSFSVDGAGKAGSVLIKAARISAAVSLKDGRVSFFDAAGKPFLVQASERMQPV